jgi:UDP-N-acetyl-2-amino-2-deoxyglucuronate dehydrogenase
MSPIRFAIIGSGGIAAQHARAIGAVPGARLVAVWGQIPYQASAFAREHEAEFVPDIEALAARQDIDAVTIATPSGTHGLAALPFLKRGKAVLCEKPLEVTLEKVEAILAAAEANRAVLAGVLQLRLGFGAQAMKRAVGQGRFGKLVLCSAYLKWWRDQAYYDAVDWRGTRALDGGGALMNQGIHGVDLLQWLAGMPSEVFAFSGCLAHQHIEVEDTIVLALKYPGGALGVIEAATSCKPGSAMRIELCGDRGTAILEDDRIVCWKFDEDRPEDESIRLTTGGAVVGGFSDPRAIGFEGHRILIEDLVSALRDKHPPMIPGAEARNAVCLILAAYESAATGQPARPRLG